MADDNDGNNMFLHVLGPDGREQVVVAYEIVDGLLDEPHVPPVPAELQGEFERLHERVTTRPASAVGRLEELVGRYPQLPALANWLTVAYAAAGRQADADAVADRLVRDHPGYLFGRLALADRHLRAGALDRVLEPLGGVADLKMIYPDRTRFHVSEAVGLWMLLGEWTLRKGDLAAAERYLRLMVDFAPDHPATTQLGLRLLARPGGFAKLLGRTDPRGPKPAKKVTDKVTGNVTGKAKAKKPDRRGQPKR